MEYEYRKIFLSVVLASLLCFGCDGYNYVSLPAGEFEFTVSGGGTTETISGDAWYYIGGLLTGGVGRFSLYFRRDILPNERYEDAVYVNKHIGALIDSGTYEVVDAERPVSTLESEEVVAIYDSGDRLYRAYSTQGNLTIVRSAENQVEGRLNFRAVDYRIGQDSTITVKGNFHAVFNCPSCE